VEKVSARAQLSETAPLPSKLKVREIPGRVQESET
jgi:hypothetical protein